MSLDKRTDDLDENETRRIREVDRGAPAQGRGRSAPRGLDEHQAPHGPRLLPRPAPPQEPAGARPAHAHERAHAQGSAQGRRRSSARRKGRALKPWPDQQSTTNKPKAKPKAKKVKKNIQSGIAHITATFNNTIVTITDVSGNVRRLVVVGREGLQGLAQVDAVRRAARRRGRRPQGDGARHALAQRCTSRARARAASRRCARSPRPASRSRSSATSPRSRTTAAGRPSAAASELARLTQPV